MGFLQQRLSDKKAAKRWTRMTPAKRTPFADLRSKFENPVSETEKSTDEPKPEQANDVAANQRALRSPLQKLQGSPAVWQTPGKRVRFASESHSSPVCGEPCDLPMPSIVLDDDSHEKVSLGSEDDQVVTGLSVKELVEKFSPGWQAAYEEGKDNCRSKDKLIEMLQKRNHELVAEKETSQSDLGFLGKMFTEIYHERLSVSNDVRQQGSDLHSLHVIASAIKSSQDRLLDRFDGVEAKLDALQQEKYAHHSFELAKKENEIRELRLVIMQMAKRLDKEQCTKESLAKLVANFHKVDRENPQESTADSRKRRRMASPKMIRKTFKAVDPAAQAFDKENLGHPSISAKPLHRSQRKRLSTRADI